MVGSFLVICCKCGWRGNYPLGACLLAFWRASVFFGLVHVYAGSFVYNVRRLILVCGTFALD